MSINIAATFHDARIVAAALKCAIPNLEGTDLHRARKMLTAVSTDLWNHYPYKSMDYFDQKTEERPLHPITMLPPEVVAANVAAREVAEAELAQRAPGS